MCINWVSKVRLDKTARCLSVWGQKKKAGIKLQYFCQYRDRKKPNQRTKLNNILDTIESESTTRFKNRSSDRMMTSDWLVDVSNDRCTTTYVKLSSAVAAILVGVLKCQTQFWKRTTQESFQQSLVEIGSVVSEEKIFFNFIPPFF